MKAMKISLVVLTILAAAATAGQNVVQQRESQQAYLTVSSAAETFRDSVLSCFLDPAASERWNLP